MGSHDRVDRNTVRKQTGGKEQQEISRRYGKWKVFAQQQPAQGAALKSAGKRGLELFGYETSSSGSDSSSSFSSVLVLVLALVLVMVMVMVLWTTMSLAPPVGTLCAQRPLRTVSRRVRRSWGSDSHSYVPCHQHIVNFNVDLVVIR